MHGGRCLGDVGVGRLRARTPQMRHSMWEREGEVGRTVVWEEGSREESVVWEWGRSRKCGRRKGARGGK